MSKLLIMAALETGLPPREQTVLAQLASFANDDGTSCRPSIGLLAKRCGADRKTIMRTTAALEDGAWLVRVHMGQRVHYLLDAPRLVALLDKKPVPKRDWPVPDWDRTCTKLVQPSDSGQDPSQDPSSERVQSREIRTEATRPANHAAAAADLARWQSVFPSQRSRLESTVRGWLRDGLPAAVAYQRIRGNVPLEVILEWRRDDLPEISK